MRLIFCAFFFLVDTILVAQSSKQNSISQIRLIDSVLCTEVKDQNNSSTCWVFGTNSLFESDLIKKYNIRVDLSEMFIARYAYIDKAKQHLATKGKTYFKGGGQFHDVLRVVKKYGIVPEETYSGLPKGEYYHDHSRLDTAMSRYIRKLMKQGKIKLNNADLRQLNDTLDRYLGKLPQKFWYNMRSYTPLSFAKDVMQFADDYVELMAYPDQPLNKKCLLDDKFNWAGDSLYNISISDMQRVVDFALANGWSVGWEGDVTEPGFNSFSGYASLDNIPQNYDEERLKIFKSEATERDHMLHLVGSGLDENNKKWYYLKNSWGTWLSSFKGYLYMSDEYFKLKTVVLMINKEALPMELRKKLSIK